MTSSLCLADMTHGAHRGYCGAYLAEEVAWLARVDGVPEQPTKIRWPKSYRRQMASRFNITLAALDRALMRHNPGGS